MSDADRPPADTGESSTKRGEDVSDDDGKEAGREGAGTQGASERPVGTSDARDSTGIDPQDPIDEDSPNLPPG